MRRYPLCWDCGTEVDTDPVYEAICGHDTCPSAVFHGLCLMTWREKREEAYKAIQRFFEEHIVIFARKEDEEDG